MIVLGIDPGITGAIGFLSHSRIPDVVDLPTVPTLSGSITRRVHAPALRSLIRQHCPNGEPVIAVLEQLATGGGFREDRRNRQQVQESQAVSHATIIATLELLGLRLGESIHILSPQKWKKFFGLGGKEKRDSLSVARELYPACHELLKRVGDHNRGEALLIARWGLQNLT